MEPFSSRYGTTVLNMAINLRQTVILTPRHDNKIQIITPGKMVSFIKDQIPNNDGRYDLFLQIFRSYNFPRGFDLETTSDVGYHSGLGGSAAFTVATIGAINRYLDIVQSRLDIAQKAQTMELHLGWVTGHQDQIASVMGGINYYQSHGFPTQVTTLRNGWENLVDYFVLFSLGHRSPSDKIQQQLVKTMNSQKTIDSLTLIKQLADKAYHSLNKPVVIGELLDESWKLRIAANPISTNSFIDDIYKTALANGAIGGKVMGAGGGGHMLFMCHPPKKHQVITTLEKNGCRQVDFSIDLNGLEVRAL